MEEIKGFRITDLPNDTHLTYNLTVLQLAKDSEAVVAKLSEILAHYEAAINTEDHYMHQMRGSELTEDIRQLDKERDRLYYILSHQIDVYLHYDESPRRTDAQNIDRYLKANRVDTQAQYDRETGMILNLVQDLRANCEAELRRLELWDNVELLAGVNERLFELVKDRLDQEAGRVPNAVADARRVTDRLYRALVSAVNGFALVAYADYAGFIRTMNLNIDRLNASVFRKGSSGSAEGQQPEGDPADGSTNGETTEGDQGDQQGDGDEVIIITPEPNE